MNSIHLCVKIPVLDVLQPSKINRMNFAHFEVFQVEMHNSPIHDYTTAGWVFPLPLGLGGSPVILWQTWRKWQWFFLNKKQTNPTKTKQKVKPTSKIHLSGYLAPLKQLRLYRPTIEKWEKVKWKIRKLRLVLMRLLVHRTTLRRGFFNMSLPLPKPLRSP